MATTYEIAVKIAGKLESTFSQSFMSAASILQKHQDKITGVKKSLKELEEAHKQGKISAEEYAASYTKLTAELEKAKAAQEGLAKAVNFQRSMEEKASAAGGKLLRSTALMTAALAGPVVAAMNFESSMADVRKVIDFETPEQFKKMGEDILSLTKRIPMTARGLADIVAAAGQAGVARDELLAFAESAAKMGVAFDITAEQAGQMMAQWRTAFKMSQKEVNELADQINYLGNTTAASAPKISDIVTKIGPLGEIGGVAAREIVALGATIGSVGIQEEVAATGIKNLVLRLNSGASATDRQKKAFKSLGLSATKLAKAMQKDASGAILSVIEALGKIPEYKRTAILTDLFGRESVAAIAPLITNIDKLRENLQKVGDATQYQGSMEKEFEERSKTTANAIRILANNINILSVNLGSVLLPPLAATAERLSGVSDKIAKWTKAHPKLTKVLVLGTAGMLAFNVAVHAMEFVVFSGLAKLAKLYVFLVKHNAVTKIATVSTKAFSLAQKGLRAVLSLSAGALHALPIVAYQIKVIAAAAATKLWTGAQVAFNLAIKLGTSLLSVARLAAYTMAVKGIAIATKVWTAAQWLLNAALSANPVALLVIAISGLVAALVILYKKSETVRNAMNALWGVIAAGATSVFQAVTNALNWVIDKVNWFIDKLNKIKLPSWLPMIGGKGVNIQMIEQIKAPAAAPAPVPGHAEGGVFSTPHVAMVAEKGPEAILPLDRLLGVIRESRTGTTAPSVNITYSPASPVINIYEQGGVSPEQIRSEVLRAERKAQEEFEARLKAFLAQQGRLSYA
jgi:TP901 family phage tail tape measure protein